MASRVLIKADLYLSRSGERRSACAPVASLSCSPKLRHAWLGHLFFSLLARCATLSALHTASPLCLCGFGLAYLFTRQPPVFVLSTYTRVSHIFSSGVVGFFGSLSLQALSRLSNILFDLCFLADLLPSFPVFVFIHI